MPKISFLPSNVVVEVEDGANIRSAGLQAGVAIPSTCGGVGSCGLCKVKVSQGAEHLGAMTQVEIGKLGNVFFITKERLSCQALVHGDVVCEVPDDSAERLRRETRLRESQRQRHQERLRSKAGR